MKPLNVGRKDDQEKSRPDLFPARVLDFVARVAAHGGRKYGDQNWTKLENLRGRYYAAALRHINAWRLGEMDDPESGLPHLAHAICSLAFVLSHDAGLDPEL